jgi:predicted adenine nucleotide alpha hydrolase (AANH) superfamily ATPase
MKLLLHTCCGPCFLGVWTELGEHSDTQTELYYFNPNIQPDEEWRKRKENLEKAVAGKSVTLHLGEYEPKRHLQAISGQEDDFPGRCPNCYRLRLSETAKFAKENGFDAFSTTLLVSPYQQHDKLIEIGEEIAKELDITFYYSDWRPYFRGGQEEAKQQGIYRQRYCGCLLSKAEAKQFSSQIL